jgi:serine/threonine-protein kinase RsbT
MTDEAPFDGEVPIVAEFDIVVARKCVREASVALGFGVTDVTRIVTAASELARNIFQYAGSGVMRWRRVSSNGRAGIELVFEDHGPGIADVALAMEVGFTTGGGLGMGLPGAKKLMGELEIRSQAGAGATVTTRKWLDK